MNSFKCASFSSHRGQVTQLDLGYTPMMQELFGHWLYSVTFFRSVNSIISFIPDWICAGSLVAFLRSSPSSVVLGSDFKLMKRFCVISRSRLISE